MVNLKESANPIVHVFNFLVASGALWSALSVGNEVENQSLENKTEVRQVKKQVEQMDERQREILKILIRVETKIEDK